MNRRTGYWIWLTGVTGPCNPYTVEIERRFGSPTAVYHATEEELRQVPYLNENQIKALCNKDLTFAHQIAEACELEGITVLTYEDERYPERLRRIQNPPGVLYCRGTVPDFDRRLCIGVVGTRNVTDSGREMAYRLGFELALCNSIVVSGLALGTDGIAQTAALDAGGITVGVLGCAIDICYPPEHGEMFRLVLERGCILSEYGPGVKTNKCSFPQRNRIISGLCQGTVIVEAGLKSGALITAKHALTQGRDIYAVPGDPGMPERVGTNALIKNGAYPVTETKDILKRYLGTLGTVIHDKNLGRPELYARYDSRLRYGKEAIARRRENAELERLKKREGALEYIPYQSGSGEIREPREEDYSEPVAKLISEEAPREATRIAQESPKKTQKKSQTVTVPKTEAPKTEAPKTEAPKTEPTITEPPKTEQPKKAKPKKEPPKTEEPKPTPAPTAPLPSEDLLTEQQRLILAGLRERKTLDEIATMGISISEIMTEMTYLEMDGYVRAIPGGFYEVITESTT